MNQPNGTAHLASQSTSNSVEVLEKTGSAPGGKAKQRKGSNQQAKRNKVSRKGSDLNNNKRSVQATKVTESDEELRVTKTGLTAPPQPNS